MSAFLTSLIPVLALILGIAGTLATESLRDRRQRDREEAKSLSERKQVNSQRREGFELEALKEAFAAFHRLGRASARQHLLDLEVSRNAGVQYASRRLDGVPGVEEIGDELLIANRDAATAIELILDDEIREHAYQAHAAFSMVSDRPKLEAQANAEFDNAVQAMTSVQREIGKRIRGLYLSEVEK